MSCERVVWIDGPGGRMFAVVHEPDKPVPSKTCILMFNAGQVSRVGPQRLYVKAARDWAAMGITVLRMDVAGVGDAQSENPVIHYDNHAPAEAAAAIRFARESLGAERIVVQGLCAGARLALKSAFADRHIHAVMAWSCPIYSAAEGMPQSPVDSNEGLSQAGARDAVSRFTAAIKQGKFLNPQWVFSHLRDGGSAVFGLFRALFHLARGKGEDRSEFVDMVDELVATSGRILFVYGDRDRISLREFEERFPDVVTSAPANQSHAVVAGGTHTFASLDAQSEVIRVSSEWLKRTAA